MYAVNCLRIGTDGYSYTAIVSRASKFTKNFSTDGYTVNFIASFRQYGAALIMAVCQLTVTSLRLNGPD